MANAVIEWISSNFGSPPDAYLFIISVSVTTSILYFLAQVKLVDRQKIKLYNERIKRWQEKRRKAMKSGSKRLMMEVEKEAELITKMQSDVGKEQFKPFMVFFLPFLIIFWLIQAAYGNIILAKLPFSLPIVGAGLTAIWVYIFSNIIISSVLNTLLKLYDEIKKV